MVRREGARAPLAVNEQAARPAVHHVLLHLGDVVGAGLGLGLGWRSNLNP